MNIRGEHVFLLITQQLIVVIDLTREYFTVELQSWAYHMLHQIKRCLQ